MATNGALNAVAKATTASAQDTAIIDLFLHCVWRRHEVLSWSRNLRNRLGRNDYSRWRRFRHQVSCWRRLLDMIWWWNERPFLVLTHFSFSCK